MKLLLVICCVIGASAQSQSLPTLVWFAKELKYSVVVARIVSVDSKAPLAVVVSRDGKFVKMEGLFEARILIDEEIFIPHSLENIPYIKRIFAPYNKNILLKTGSDNPNVWEDDIGRKPRVMVITGHPQLELKVTETCVGSLPLTQLPLVEKEIHNSVIKNAEYLRKWDQLHRNRQKDR